MIQHSYDGRRSPTQAIEKAPAAYLEIARGMERQFVRYMIEQMRKTIKPTQSESTPLRFYQSMLFDYHADIMTQRNEGQGLQKMILKQIYSIDKKGLSK